MLTSEMRNLSMRIFDLCAGESQREVCGALLNVLCMLRASECKTRADLRQEVKAVSAAFEELAGIYYAGGRPSRQPRSGEA